MRDKVRKDLGLPPWKVHNPAGLVDHAMKHGINPSFELSASLAGNTRSARDGHGNFQTLMLSDPLDRHLSKIRDTARTIAEETGVSTLHLAFGFLEWFESGSSDKPLTSPILLIRVDIERKIVRTRYQYALLGTGDEAEVNLTLSERLNRDFNILLPERSEDEEPTSYLERIQEEVCKSRKGWAVRRYLTLAHFPFARLAMFHDLDEAAWSTSGGLAAHPLLGELLGGSESRSDLFAAEHDVDGPEVTKMVPMLVLEADASQHSAVYDALSGKNLVIEGPPGTGKSQTITNIIAAALAKGKRVLFMADKQAALQVVKDRLDKVGLGDFCLELHSGKARKKDVVEALKHRLSMKPTNAGMGDLDATLQALVETRDGLTKYVNILNTPIGSFGATVHDILWGDRRRRTGESNSARHLDSLLMASCQNLTQPEIGKRTAALDRFEDAACPILSEFGSLDAHPWNGVTRHDLSSVDFEQVVRDIGDAAAAIEDADKTIMDLESHGVVTGSTIQDIQLAITAIARLSVPKGASVEWYRGLRDGAARTVAADLLRSCDSYRSAVSDLANANVVTNGLSGMEAANDLAKCWAGLTGMLVPALPVSGLAAWSADLRTQAQQMRDFAGNAAKLTALLGIHPPENLREVAATLKLVDLAVQAGEQVVTYITPELTARNSKDPITAAAGSISNLRAREQALANEFNMLTTCHSEELRRHATALREAGVFGFLKPSMNAATRCYRQLRKVPEKKVSRQEMATALVSIAEQLEAVAELNKNQEYRTAFGNHFRGLATNINAAMAVAEWAALVRRELAGVDVVNLAARQTLLSGDRDRLQALVAYGTGHEVAALREYISYPRALAASFHATAYKCEDSAAAVEALSLACSRHAIPEVTVVSTLPDLCLLLRAAHSAEIAARVPEQLAVQLSFQVPGPLDELDNFRSSLALASSVASLPLDGARRAKLHDMHPEALQSIVNDAASNISPTIGLALEGWLAVCHRLGLDERAFLGRSMMDSTFAGLAQRLRISTHHPEALASWISYLIQRKEAEYLDLGGLLVLWDKSLVEGTLAEAFDRVLHRALARQAFTYYPELDRFTGLGQEEARERFKFLDNQATEFRRKRLIQYLLNLPIPTGNGIGKRGDYTDRALILLEAGKQKKHIPIRQMLDRAGAAVQALKPCFMMSPLAVSQYLKPNGLRFDLLVIDEASQMRPEDALAAIARSAQIVVVGDPKQLPPTSFFTRLDIATDDDAEDEEVDAEAILDLAQAVFRPMRRLRWHYRSRHGSLIAFSNRQFYDGDLIVFPSPSECNPTQGVTSTNVNGLYKARSNIVEVSAVCEAAVAHMRGYPDRSLGIATLNQVQRDLIAQEMDRLATTVHEVEKYRERWSGTLVPTITGPRVTTNQTKTPRISPLFGVTLCRASAIVVTRTVLRQKP